MRNPPKKCSGLLGKAGPTCSAWCWRRGDPASSTWAVCPVPAPGPLAAHGAPPAPGALPMQPGMGRRSRERASRGGTRVGDDPSHCQPWANSRGKGYAAGGIEQPLAGKCFIPSLSKTHLQTASFHATAPGPSASSSMTWRGVLGKSSQAFVHLVKLEGYLFLLPAVWFLSGGCTSRRDHLPPAGSKRSDGQGSVAETLVPAQDIPAKIRIRSGRRSPPGSAWDSGAGREGPCLYSASRELQHPAVIPSPLRRDAQISLICI